LPLLLLHGFSPPIRSGNHGLVSSPDATASSLLTSAVTDDP
jgi:hypothetical protein